MQINQRWLLKSRRKVKIKVMVKNVSSPCRIKMMNHPRRGQKHLTQIYHLHYLPHLGLLKKNKILRTRIDLVKVHAAIQDPKKRIHITVKRIINLKADNRYKMGPDEDFDILDEYDGNLNVTSAPGFQSQQQLIRVFFFNFLRYT